MEQITSKSIEMETRSCAHCGKQFRVWIQSAQQFHTRYCEAKGPCPDHKKAWSVAKPASETVNVSVGPPTRPTERGSHVAARQAHFLPKLLRKNEPASANTTPETRNEKTPSELNGARKTESASSPSKGISMHETNPQPAQELRSIAVVKTQPAVSSKPSLNAPLVASESMNLIDDSAKHLHGLMLGLTANKPDATVRLYDADTVNAACNCGKQIYQLLRLKLDVIKAQREFEKEKR